MTRPNISPKPRNGVTARIDGSKGKLVAPARYFLSDHRLKQRLFERHSRLQFPKKPKNIFSFISSDEFALPPQACKSSCESKPIETVVAKGFEDDNNFLRFARISIKARSIVPKRFATPELKKYNSKFSYSLDLEKQLLATTKRASEEDQIFNDPMDVDDCSDSMFQPCLNFQPVSKSDSITREVITQELETLKTKENLLGLHSPENHTPSANHHPHKSCIEASELNPKISSRNKSPSFSPAISASFSMTTLEVVETMLTMRTKYFKSDRLNGLETGEGHGKVKEDNVRKHLPLPLLADRPLSDIPSNISKKRRIVESVPANSVILESPFEKNGGVDEKRIPKEGEASIIDRLAEVRSDITISNQNLRTDLRNAVMKTKSLEQELASMKLQIQDLLHQKSETNTKDSSVEKLENKLFKIQKAFLTLQDQNKFRSNETGILKESLHRLNEKVTELECEKEKAVATAKKIEQVAQRDSHHAKSLIVRAYEQVAGAEKEAFRLQKVLQDEAQNRQAFAETVCKQIQTAISETNRWDSCISNRISKLESKLNTLQIKKSKLEKLIVERAKRKRTKNTDKSNHLCIVCFSSSVSIVFVPCGHRSVCEGCATKVDYCPLCRNKIQMKVRSFDAGVTGP